MLSKTYAKRFAKCRCLADYTHLTAKTKKLGDGKYEATITCDLCGEVVSVIGFSAADAITRLVQTWNDNRFKPLNDKQRQIIKQTKEDKKEEENNHIKPSIPTCICGCTDLKCVFSKKGAGMFLATVSCTKCGNIAYGVGSTKKEAQLNAYENIQKEDESFIKDCVQNTFNQEVSIPTVTIKTDTTSQPAFVKMTKYEVAKDMADVELEDEKPSTLDLLDGEISCEVLGARNQIVSDKALIEFFSKHIDNTNELINKGQEVLSQLNENVKTQNLILNTVIKKMVDIQTTLLELLRLEKASIEGVEIGPSCNSRQP